MGALKGLLSIFGGLCAVMGIITATEVIKPTYAGIDDWMFWFGLAAILFIAGIAVSAGRSE
jgi:hypothetical protein